MKHNCYKNLKRIGRAKYQCNICKKDLSLELVLLYMAVGKERFNKAIKRYETNTTNTINKHISPIPR